MNCATAIRVENDYAAIIRAGQIRGNGGGAPVVVNGWTCQGYPTPEVLSTGNASRCHTGSAAIVAVLLRPWSFGDGHGWLVRPANEVKARWKTLGSAWAGPSRSWPSAFHAVSGRAVCRGPRR